MDIKDFILIFGCLLIIAVVCHGFWIAWRARNESLPLDIMPDMVPPDDDELGTLRGELPNGGARRAIDDWAPAPAELMVASAGSQAALDEARAMPAQASLALDNPVSESASGNTRAAALRREMEAELLGRVPDPAPAAQPASPVARDLFDADDAAATAAPDDDDAEHGMDVTDRAAAELGVREVLLPEPPEPELVTEDRSTAGVKPATNRVASAQPAANQTLDEAESEDDEPGELIVIQLLAPEGERFAGNVLFATLRQHGLKFGEQNIFHRIPSDQTQPTFSVVNIVKPGFFDLAEIEDFSTPGVAFFMTLPGPADPLTAFDDMIRIARRLCGALNGRLVDDSRSQLTGQTVAHLRENVARFRLRSYSRKAL
ncbi:MAG: cell division protein ZipA [Pseudomonadota bacterium]